LLKNCRLLFSAVISEHFSKNRMIISTVAAKIWYLKNVRFLLGHPVLWRRHHQLHILAGNVQRHINHYLSLFKHVLQCRDDTKSQG